MIAEILIAVALVPVDAADKIVDVAADDRPCPASADQSVHARIDELQCLTAWLERNADLGKSKRVEERKFFERQRGRVKPLIKKIDAWAASVEDHGVPTVSADAKRRSQQHYLSGVIFFQKGDYEKARGEWRLSRELDPTNTDAAAGLDRLARLYGE